MQWTNSKDGYGWIAISLHWLAFVAILLMLTTGFRAEFLGDAGDREGRAAAMAWHISFGASFVLILLARILSSYLQPKPAPVEQSKELMFLATATHQILLLAILIQIISGPLAVWSGGRAINVFDLFAIPSPFAARNEGIHEAAELMHAIGRWTIIIAASLHILAVVKHTLFGDGIIQRMLSPRAND
jgi:cytochrome b561